MRNIKEISIASIIGIFIIVAGLFTYDLIKPEDQTEDQINVGSVVDQGTYTYRNITSSNASSTAPVIINKISGTFGSIIVASSSGSTLDIYDSSSATSSNATLIVSLPTSAIEQVYTFDVAVKRGLVLDVPASFNGNYTVTFR